MENNETKIPVIVVVGPTASGKTGLGVEICKHFGGEVVSADSMQVYRGMDIASAMPTRDEMQGIPHHMLGVLSQDERFSVAAYCEAAKECVFDINSRSRLPVVVGGTGLYINSLIDNIEYSQEETDLTLREKLVARLETEGVQALLRELAEVDPETAARLHENDSKRIIRALEFYCSSGITLSEQARRSRLHGSPFKPLFIGLNARDRQFLYDRINRRVDIMVENGLIDEARASLENRRATSAQAIGHKELAGYLNSEEPLEAALDRLKQQTRRYAKRQLTWFGRDERVNWLYIDEYENSSALAKAAFELCEEFLNGENK